MAKSADAFRTISEVADWLQTPAHVLRFWESKFSQVKPVKRAGGRRYYRPSDMELLGGIKRLLHEEGMTIKGVQKILRDRGITHVAAMSPPLDELSATLEDDTVVHLPAEMGEATDAPFEAPEPEEALSPSPDLSDDTFAESAETLAAEEITEAEEMPAAEELTADVSEDLDLPVAETEADSGESEADLPTGSFDLEAETEDTAEGEPSELSLTESDAPSSLDADMPEPDAAEEEVMPSLAESETVPDEAGAMTEDAMSIDDVSVQDVSSEMTEDAEEVSDFSEESAFSSDTPNEMAEITEPVVDETSEAPEAVEESMSFAADDMSEPSFPEDPEDDDIPLQPGVIAALLNRNAPLSGARATQALALARQLARASS